MSVSIPIQENHITCSEWRKKYYSGQNGAIAPCKEYVLKPDSSVAQEQDHSDLS